MATRRARIKAVANLPIRRKPEAKPQVASDLENLVTACAPSKLVNSITSEAPLKTSPLKLVTNTQSSDIILSENSVETENSNPSIIKSVEIEKPVTPPKDTSVENNVHQKQTIRRRICKPTIRNPPREKSVINLTPSEQTLATESIEPAILTNVCQSENNDNEISELEGKASPIKQATSELSNNVNSNSVPSTENVKPSMDVITADNDDSLFNAPASPSKNRPRIRPTPRLGHRRNSIQGSASESEDDGRRSQTSFLPNRIRTESSSSFINDTISEPPMSPRKEKFKPRQRSRRTEQSQKLIERKKEFACKYGSAIPDRSKMTVFDMIYYNPSSNPMKQPEKKPRDVTDAKVIQEESVDDPTQADDEDEEEIAVPQLKVGLNGELILDEQSLVIETTGTKKGREKLANSDVIYDSDNTSYGIYKKHKRCKDWKPAETIRFYNTLNRLGTDFSMMLALFPERTRRDLRNKYKKEEKINGALIDMAIRNPKTFDIGALEKQFQAEKEAAEKAENERKNMKKEKKKSTYKRNKKIRLYESSEDSQEDSVNNGLLHMAQKADPDVFKKYKLPTKREKIKRDAKKRKMDINVEDLPVEDALVNLKENVNNTNTNLEAENGILVLANTAINQTLLQQNGLGMNNNIELQEEHVNEIGSKEIENTTQSNAVQQEKMDVSINEDVIGLFNEVNLTQSCKDLIDLQIQENISNGLSIAEENIFCEDQIDALMSETDNNLSKDYVNEIIIENSEGDRMHDDTNNVIANVLETKTCETNQVNLANEMIIENPEGNCIDEYTNNVITNALETNTCPANQINVANEMIIENSEGNHMDGYTNNVKANVLETDTCQPNQINVANEIIIENPEGNCIDEYTNNVIANVLETKTCETNQIYLANEMIIENSEGNCIDEYTNNVIANALETNTCQPNQINVANEIIVENPEGNLMEKYENNFITNVLDTNACKSNQINLANGSTVDISNIPIEIDNIGAYNYNEIIEEDVNSHTETSEENEIAMNDNVESGSYVIKAKPCPIRPSVTIYEVFLKTYEDGKCIFTPIDLTEDELQSCINHMLPVTE